MLVKSHTRPNDTKFAKIKGLFRHSNCQNILGKTPGTDYKILERLYASNEVCCHNMRDISVSSRCKFIYDQLLERPFHKDLNGVCLIFGG